jgi:hypothetical protein
VASGNGGMEDVDDLPLPGSAIDDKSDELEDDRVLEDESDQVLENESDEVLEDDSECGEASDDASDDAHSETEDDQPTQGEDSQHCPGCGWCDAERMVVCEVDACSQWYQVHCLELSKREADELSDPDFLWLCPDCDPSQDEE